MMVVQSSSLFTWYCENGIPVSVPVSVRYLILYQVSENQALIDMVCLGLKKG